jgi:hypothetical protein
MTMMMTKTMQKGQASHQKCQDDHPIFKSRIMYNVHTQHRQTDQQQRKKGAMNSAQYGGTDAQDIPIDLTQHMRQKTKIAQTQQCCKYIYPDIFVPGRCRNFAVS